MAFKIRHGDVTCVSQQSDMCVIFSGSFKSIQFTTSPSLVSKIVEALVEMEPFACISGYQH